MADFDFVSAVDLTNTGNYNDRVGVGFKFTNTTGTDIVITQLGRWTVSGNSQTHLLGIYTTTAFSSPVASVTVNTSGATPAQFLYGVLSSPYTLVSGATVYIMSGENSGGDRWVGPAPGGSPGLTTPNIGTTSSANVISTTIAVTGNVSHQYTSWGPTTFRFSSPAVPGFTKLGTTYTTTGYMFAVNNAIADAAAGDRINLPAGTFTYGGGGQYVSISKPVIVMGAGSASTVINISSGTPTWSAGGAVNITSNATFGGVEMIQPGTGNTTAVIATGTSGWRLTDIKYTSAATRGYFLYTSTFGLIDHCYIDGGGGNDEWIFVRGPSDAWLTDPTLGTVSAVYLEDNTLYDQGYFDINANGKLVARFNTVTPIGQIKYDLHGYATNGGQSGRTLEAYANYWTTSSGVANWEYRGGGGVAFANTTAGGQAFYLEDYGYQANNTAWGCYQTPSNYPLFQQVGSGKMTSIPVTSIAAYQRVQVNSTGTTTNWSLIGAPSAAPASGVQFTATGPGTGDGTAYIAPITEPMYLWGNRQSSGAAAWARGIKNLGTASSFNTNVVGYSIGATTINLTSRNTAGSGNGQIGVGDAVLFANHSTRYLVTSGLANGATTGTITISPGLTSALVGSVIMTSGPLVDYQQQTGNNSATFTERDIIQQNRDFYADSGFDNGAAGVTVGTANAMSLLTPVGKNKQGFWVTDEGNWNLGFSGTINGSAIAALYFCEIVVPGSPSFTSIGAKDNLAGTQFVASGPLTSYISGTVKPAQGRLYVSNNVSWVLSYTPYVYPHPSQGTFPSLSTATVNSAGTSLTLVWTESCTTGAGGAGGFTLSASGGAVTVNLPPTGSGSATYVYPLSRSILSGETLTVSYVQPGNGIEATTGGADVPSFSASPVINGSAVSGSQASSLRPLASISGGF